MLSGMRVSLFGLSPRHMFNTSDDLDAAYMTTPSMIIDFMGKRQEIDLVRND